MNITHLTKPDPKIALEALRFPQNNFLLVGNRASSIQEIQTSLKVFHQTVGKIVERINGGPATERTPNKKLLADDFVKSVQRALSALDKGIKDPEGNPLVLHKLHAHVQDAVDAIFKVRALYLYNRGTPEGKMLVSAVKSSVKKHPEFFETLLAMNADVVSGGAHAEGIFKIRREGRGIPDWELSSENYLPLLDNLFAGAKAIFIDSEPGLGSWLKFTYALQLIQVGHLPRVPIYLVGGEKDWGDMAKLATCYLRNDIYGVPMISRVNPEAQGANDAKLFTIVDTIQEATELFKAALSDPNNPQFARTDPLDPKDAWEHILSDGEFIQIDLLILPKLMDLESALESLTYRTLESGAVSIFGSARTHPDHVANVSGSLNVYETVKVLAKNLAEAGYMIVNGGGPGAMEAATLGALAIRNKGATRITVDLPFEPHAPDERTVQHHHARFSSRLTQFWMASDCFIVTPGGYGSLLETLWVARCNQILIKKGQKPKPLIIAKVSEDDPIADALYGMLARLHQAKRIEDAAWHTQGIPFVEIIDVRDGGIAVIERLHEYGIVGGDFETPA